MLKKAALALSVLVSLTACASQSPRIIQATTGMDEIRITAGMATQVEMPEGGRVVSVAVGDPNIISAEKDADVVSLVGKGPSGETNLIVRARDDDGDLKVYQYRVVVQGR